MTLRKLRIAPHHERAIGALSGSVVLLGVLLFLAACTRQGASLADIEGLLQSRLARVGLGDHEGLTFDPPVQADWFVIFPAAATEGSFLTSPAFRKYAPQVPAELLNRAEPGMAYLRGGKVVDLRDLLPAYTAKQVLAKPGSTAHGVRFVRLAGSRRNYVILAID